jgi:hypothetical protein
VKEIWQLATSPGVLPATLLLIPILLYWIIGALGVFNLDLDGVDPSAGHLGGDGMHHSAADSGGVHSHADSADAASDGSQGDQHDGVFSNIMAGMTRLVNARDIPLMAVLSLITIFFWSCLMITHHLCTAFVPEWALALASLAGAILLTRVATIPLRPFFLALKKDSETHLPVIGRTGIVRTWELSDRSGQIEVPDRIGPMLLNARLKPGVDPVPKGTEVIVFEHDPARGIYYVKAL